MGSILRPSLSARQRRRRQRHPQRPPLVETSAGPELLVHVQFETIYPFPDGNGRLGRLLITFLPCVAGAIREPILYLSLYFKTNRNTMNCLTVSAPRLGDLARIFSNGR